jgi:hypothetical protein
MKVGFLLLLLLISYKSFSQKPDSLFRDDFSIEADANYYRYVASEGLQISTVMVFPFI